MSKRKIIIIAVGLLVVLLVVAGGIVMTSRSSQQPLLLSISFQPANAAAAVEPAPVQEPSAPASLAGLPIDIGSKVVNLADPGGYRYLRVSIVLEVPYPRGYASMSEEEKKKEEQTLKDDITRFRPAIDDALITLLSNKAFGDIFTLQGKENLKNELIQAINERLGEGLQVTRLYFTDFIIQ